MLIVKVLNNNAIITKSKDGVEQVVCGRGIAFKKHSGDSIPDDGDYQIFELKNGEMNRKFKDIVSTIPYEYIELAEKAVQYIQLNLGKKIDPSIYVTLSDHMYTAIERAKQGIHMPNTMLWEISNYYMPEYKIAKDILKMIQEQTGVELKDDEAGFIALHIVNAETEGAVLENTVKQTKIVREVARIVRNYFQVQFDMDSVFYYRFITHLKFFAQRIVTGVEYEGSGDESLYDIVKVNYKDAFECSERIVKMIESEYSYHVSREEQIYLTIHIHQIIFTRGNH